MFIMAGVCGGKWRLPKSILNWPDRPFYKISKQKISRQNCRCMIYYPLSTKLKTTPTISWRQGKITIINCVNFAYLFALSSLSVVENILVRVNNFCHRTWELWWSQPYSVRIPVTNTYFPDELNVCITDINYRGLCICSKISALYCNFRKTILSLRSQLPRNGSCWIWPSIMLRKSSLSWCYTPHDQDLNKDSISKIIIVSPQIFVLSVYIIQGIIVALRSTFNERCLVKWI